jgi:hypothetical protein
MRMPGFTAQPPNADEIRGRSRCMAISGYSKKPREVISQLQDRILPARGGGVFGPITDHWNCIQGCGSAYSSCLERCEGHGSLHCVTCDEEYRACLDECSRGGVGVGGGGIGIA